MSKPVAVFDIDGTIFRSSLVIELSQALIDQGAIPAAVRQQYEPAYLAWRNREAPYQTYLDNLIVAFETAVRGLPTSLLEQAADEVISRTAKETYRFTRDLISSLKPTHALIAISGSPAELVSRFCQFWGFLDFHATKYHTRANRYTGKVTVATKRKDLAVRRMLKKHDLILKGSVGVGDTESDAAFLQLVERPIAFNPNSGLFQTAVSSGWQVVVERKDVIYYYPHATV